MYNEKEVSYLKHKKYNVKSILLTMLLILILIGIFYSLVGIFISGGAIKDRNEQVAIVEKIKSKTKGVEKVTRNVFKFVTYTAQTEKKFVFFDENAKKIAVRNRNDAKFDEVNEIIRNEYPSLEGVKIEVGYGKKNPAYIIEKEYELLVLDFKSLKKVFYMKEGE